MTAPVSFTRAHVRRAIAAARDMGLPGDVTIAPDGSIRIHSAAAPSLAPDATNAHDVQAADKWSRA